MNLYQVSGYNYNYMIFIFTTSRNRAKILGMNCFGDDDKYTDMRCKTLAKNIGGRECVVDSDIDAGYKRVTDLGFKYYDEVKQ